MAGKLKFRSWTKVMFTMILFKFIQGVFSGNKKVDCGPLYDPLKDIDFPYGARITWPSIIGSVVYKNHSTTVGSVAQFRCEKGYYVRGPKYAVCGANGKWVIREKELRCDRIDCIEPDFDIEHGKVETSSEDISPRTFILNSIYWVKCDYGYKPNGSAVRVCLINGTDIDNRYKGIWSQRDEDGKLLLGGDTIPECVQDINIIQRENDVNSTWENYISPREDTICNCSHNIERGFLGFLGILYVILIVVIVVIKCKSRCMQNWSMKKKSSTAAEFDVQHNDIEKQELLDKSGSDKFLMEKRVELSNIQAHNAAIGIKDTKDKVEHELYQTKQDNAKAGHEPGQTKQDKAKVEHELDQTKQDKSEVEHELDQTKHDKAKLELELDQTKQDKAKVEQELNQTKQDKSEVEHELDQTKQDKAKVEIELDKTKQDKAKVEHELDQTKQERTKVEHERNHAKLDKAMVEHALDQSKQDKAKLEHELDQTKQDIFKVEHELDQTKHDKAKVEHELDQTKQDKARVQHELDQTKQDKAKVELARDQINQDKTNVEHDKNNLQKLKKLTKGRCSECASNTKVRYSPLEKERERLVNIILKIQTQIAEFTNFDSFILSNKETDTGAQLLKLIGKLAGLVEGCDISRSKSVQDEDELDIQDKLEEVRNLGRSLGIPCIQCEQLKKDCEQKEYQINRLKDIITITKSQLVGKIYNFLDDVGHFKSQSSKEVAGLNRLVGKIAAHLDDCYDKNDSDMFNDYNSRVRLDDDTECPEPQAGTSGSSNGTVSAPTRSTDTVYKPESENQRDKQTADSATDNPEEVDRECNSEKGNQSDTQATDSATGYTADDGIDINPESGNQGDKLVADGADGNKGENNIKHRVVPSGSTLKKDT